MQIFDIRDAFKWTHILGGKYLEMPAPKQARRVRITLNVTERTNVFLEQVDGDGVTTGKVLVASSDGMFDIAFTHQHDAKLYFATEKGAVIWYREHTGVDFVQADLDKKSYTLPTPTGRRNSDFDRMMQFMKLNEKRREEETRDARAEWAKEMAALRDKLDAKAVVDDPKPKGKEDDATPAPKADDTTPDPSE